MDEYTGFYAYGDGDGTSGWEGGGYGEGHEFGNGCGGGWGDELMSITLPVWGWGNGSSNSVTDYREDL